VAPPSMDVLAKRLTGRGTENEAAVRERLERAEMEIAQADRFDATVVNDELDRAVDETLAHIAQFLGR